MKKVFIIVDNGCATYHQSFDIDKVPLDEMIELFKIFVETKGILREC